MSSGIGGGISGGAGKGRGGGGGSHRKNSKKFGKNLNKLTKAPAAPPVPVISAASGAGSSSSFRGSSSSRNGLLLLSTKSKTSGSGGSGLLGSPGTPKTAHDALLLSAGAGGQGGGEAVKKSAPAPAWGIGEKKPAAPPPEKVVERSGQVKAKPDLVLSRRNYLQQPKPFPLSSAVIEVAENLEKMDLKTADAPKKITPASGTVVKPCDRLISNAIQLKEKTIVGATKPKKNPLAAASCPKEEPVVVAKQAPQKEEKVKDDQVEYMSKLAKERTEKLRIEEEARMAAQKERAAIRLRQLEEKRLEEKKRQLEEEKRQLEEKKKQHQQLNSQARKELSKPQVILEPLGKSKKESSGSFSPKPAAKTQPAEKTSGRKLYDPDRPYSSLVGGRTTKPTAEHAKTQEERPRGNSKKSLSPAVSPAAPHSKPAVQSSADNKKEEPLHSIHMVQLSNLDELDRGGRVGGQGGPRMLFDPTSGSMVAVNSREEPKTTKKAKQSKGPQKSPAKRSEEPGKITSRRSMDGVVGNESGSEVKLLRGKQGKGSRKDEPMLFQPKNKKLIDNKGRTFGQHHTTRKLIPRTCGVLYKMDKSGNYINADGCEPDNGYGANRAPGGKVKNPGAYAQLLKEEEEKNAASQPASSDAAPASEGFSFRNDPGFLQHQTDFEAQQQKILEDAWASLVENEELPREEETEEEEAEKLPTSRSGEDEYAAALAISPSAIGLTFDPVDDTDSVLLPPAIKASAKDPINLAKFALEAAVAKPANPFTPLGVSSAGLWGGGTHCAVSASSYGDLGSLTGWTATPFGDCNTAGAAGSSGPNSSSPQASKLHLWGGSTTLDDAGLGSFGNSDASKGD